MNEQESYEAKIEQLRQKINKAFGDDDMPKAEAFITTSDNPQFIPNPRFIASIAAMQGLLASPTDFHVQNKDAEFIAKYAVECADALLNELNVIEDEDNN